MRKRDIQRFLAGDVGDTESLHELADEVDTPAKARTGKAADVFLVERSVPGAGGRSCLMAAKRYRGGDDRLFHRDAGYLEGRRVRDSRLREAGLA